MRKGQIYFVEEIILDQTELVATGGTIIRVYDLVNGTLELIDRVYGTVDQNSLELVKNYLKGNYKFVKQL